MRSLTDSSIRIILIGVILIYIAVWIAGIRTGKTATVLSVLNAAAGLTVIGYWGIRQLQIKQPVVETREMAVLCFELVVVAFSLYSRAGQGSGFVKAVTCVFFGVHLAALLLFLLYMTVFKITRLF